MMCNLHDMMQMWRDGQLSNGEMLLALLAAQHEVVARQIAEETARADEHVKELLR